MPKAHEYLRKLSEAKRKRWEELARVRQLAREGSMSSDPGVEES
jgi:hypothetical protein